MVELFIKKGAEQRRKQPHLLPPCREASADPENTGLLQVSFFGALGSSTTWSPATGISHCLWKTLSINGKLEGLSLKPSEVAVEVGAQPCPLVSAPGLNQVEGAASVTPEQLLHRLGTKTAQATACRLGGAGLLTKSLQWAPGTGAQRHTGDAAGAGWLLQQQLGDRHILPAFCPLYSRL